MLISTGVAIYMLVSFFFFETCPEMFYRKRDSRCNIRVNVVRSLLE